MIDEVGPTLAALLILLIWQVTKSLVFLGAATVCLMSRNAARRAEARRVLRLLAGRPDTPPD
jgi:hypothetical protein